jgi:hypothetical protein
MKVERSHVIIALHPVSNKRAAFKLITLPAPFATGRDLSKKGIVIICCFVATIMSNTPARKPMISIQAININRVHNIPVLTIKASSLRKRSIQLGVLFSSGSSFATVWLLDNEENKFVLTYLQTKIS